MLCQFRGVNFLSLFKIRHVHYYMYVYNILLCLQRLIFYPVSKADLLLIKKRNKLNTRSSPLLKKYKIKLKKSTRAREDRSGLMGKRWIKTKKTRNNARVGRLKTSLFSNRRPQSNYYYYDTSLRQSPTYRHYYKRDPMRPRPNHGRRDRYDILGRTFIINNNVILIIVVCT